MDTRFVVIGGGTMARAIILGCVAKGLHPAAAFLVIEPDAGARRGFEEVGVATAEEIGAASAAIGRNPPPMVLLAVKPQSLESVSAQWQAAGVKFDGIVVSILAGTPSAKVRAALGGGVRVIRAMPNTPARIGQGATAVALGDGARSGDEHAALALFAALGPVVEVVSESMMDVVTALSGSGPAYLFYLAEAMKAAAVEAGMDGGVADRLIRQTLVGAAGLLAESPGTPAEALRAAVTSKGGTTEAACNVLDQRGVGEAVRAAVIRARDRGRELGG